LGKIIEVFFLGKIIEVFLGKIIEVFFLGRMMLWSLSMENIIERSMIFENHRTFDDFLF